MDDFEDYRTVFFQECDELLDDLEERLGALAAGSGDPEAVNAAFRTVHSIKGGADAFGLRELVGFAHVFEAALDAIRGGRLDATQEVSAVLVRGRDVLCSLVEQARAGAEGALPDAAGMIGELTALTPGAPDRPAMRKTETPAAPEDAGDPARPRRFRIRFAPGQSFQTSGHDPLRMIRALRRLGTIQVRAGGEVPHLADLDPDICPLTWEIGLETGLGADAVESFFQIYRATAEIGIAPEDARAAPPPAAAGPGPPAPTPGPAAPGRVARTLRVDLERVDRLVNLVGEIVVSHAAMAQSLNDGEAGRPAAGNPALGQAADTLSRQVRELQESVMVIRAQPVKAVFSRVTRLVRDLAQQLGKEVRVEISGEHTEVDSTVIDEMAEPLIHMVRNAMDHGIEAPEDRLRAGKPRQGVLSIAATHRGERVAIRVADDGRGIDRDRVLAKAVERGLVASGADPAPEEIDEMVFHPGLSTAGAATDVSGRGVGLDVVRRNIGALGGRVHLENRPREGTRITLTLPLSLAVLDGMTVAVGGQRFVIPLGTVAAVMPRADAAEHRLPGGALTMVRGGKYLPLLSVRDALGIAGPHDNEQLVVIVSAGAQGDTDGAAGGGAGTDGRTGLLVDAMIGQRQVVLKSLEANYHGVPGISGATILGDGRAALILDVQALCRLASTVAPPPEAATLEPVQ